MLIALRYSHNPESISLASYFKSLRSYMARAKYLDPQAGARDVIACLLLQRRIA